VTNSQFGIFIEEQGYQNSAHWSAEGWAWRQREQATEPRYFNDNRFDAPNQPVVGVSWWEADAFFRWAGGRLPTEQEWEAATRGSAAREYPWDGPWRDGICNSHESGLGTTSPVGLFPSARQADSGLEDLAGNVWEWVSGEFLLRGGSWFNETRYVRAAIRSNDDPDFRLNDVGFRVLLCLRPD